MKPLNLFMLFAACITCYALQAQDLTKKNDPSRSWYSTVTNNIQLLSYQITPIANGNYRAKNDKQSLEFIIYKNGYEVKNKPVYNSSEGWQTNFTFSFAGRMGQDNILSYKIPGKEIKTNNSLEYQSSKASIQYINDSNGLRQNFIINERPKGNGMLTARINIQSSLSYLQKENNQVVFHKHGKPSEIKFIYEDLKVWDANYKILPARLETDIINNTISILVDDANATYPVTIDPLNRTPDWSTSADGILPGLLTNLQMQVQTIYGYTVAGLGDVNNDGYDDVAVSAPGMADVISGNGSLSAVGAVFIYLGSASGLATIPSKVLQPTTAVNGALFGYSIDAGDVTGDGINDIVIGAPMDKYQTTASTLLGTASVQVTAGKVYVYRSEDLFTAANPTPFAELKLQGPNFFSTGVLNVLNSNVNIKSLFGYSVAISKDLNGDNKADLLIGTPSYAGTALLSAQSGAAFVYYSNNLFTTNPVQLQTPTPALLGLVSLPVANTNGLLFGYSISGVGDYNSDTYNDVVVGAPAGINLSSLGGIYSGQFLGGSAFVFYGNGTGINTASTVRLQASPSGLLSNAANLFGFKVKGSRNAFGNENGNILISAPIESVLSNVPNGLRVKAGQLHVFKKRTGPVPAAVIADQQMSSPRSSSILNILAGQTLNVSMLYGSSFDNTQDVNCDNIGDIIVGEPLSTAVPMIGADVVGGAAYVYYGKPDGTYNTTPSWDLYTEISPMLGVNTTALLGYSVTGAGHTKGPAREVSFLVGAPSNTLDFGSGLFNFGNTLGTTFDFVFDNNGLGKSYSFSSSPCNATLPANLLMFKATTITKAVLLSWATSSEDNLDYYELQRSQDGSHYETISIHFAKAEFRNDYSFKDKHPLPGLNHYRLKMIDKDGQVKYSYIVSAQFNEHLPGNMVITPNPVENDIQIKVEGMEKGEYQMELRNTIGQTIARQKIMINQYSQTIIMKRNNRMSAGIYWLSIYNHANRKISTLRVLIGVQ